MFKMIGSMFEDNAIPQFRLLLTDTLIQNVSVFRLGEIKTKLDAYKMDRKIFCIYHREECNSQNVLRVIKSPTTVILRVGCRLHLYTFVDA
jgi:hypothetical protein